LPMLGSMWTSIPHIFHNISCVQVPALLLYFFSFFGYLSTMTEVILTDA
jgi:hypothetical protein